MSTLLAAMILAQTVTDTITVTATRTETRVADTPASVVVLSREALETTAAVTTDEALRQVAGFTLFRRAGSRVANPTAQGVTLRGVGASGASRALVLDDGVPLNDPFGGWVYWGRVPRAALDRVEVLRGGASDLYGSSAMGGVVQFIRRKTPGVMIDATAGSQRTASTSLFAGMRRGSWTGDVAADLFTTDGYVLVRPEERGPVDTNATSNHASIDATLRREAAFVRASYYRETRDNGTPMQENDTAIRQLAAGGDVPVGGGSLMLRLFGSDQDYFQTFSAVSDDRTSERLTVEQSVPSRGAGGTAQWTRAFAARHVFVVGTEIRRASGTSDELRFTPAGTFRVEAGGTQETVGVYLEDLFVVTPAVSITAGLRTDWWRSEATGGNASREGQLNPRVSLLVRANERLSLAASAYSAFRAPTLNELYRGFRVGNINTLPNAALTSENLTGFEVGARAANARLTIFWMTVTDAIANVTLGESNGTITRQRQNLGTTRSIGAELDGEWRLSPRWRASASWLFADATVRDGDLRGKRVPQVPRHQATAQLLFTSSFSAGLQTRWSAAQFDDDRNDLHLSPYFLADLFASYPLARGFEATAAIENLFDADVEVSATPVVTLGQGRGVRVGVRYRR